MVNKMEKALVHFLTVQSMQASGRIMLITEKACSKSLMVQSILENIRMVRSMEKAV